MSIQNSEKETPQHKHDCDTCIFLGRFGDKDLYFHDGGEHRRYSTTLIARDGPLGEYSSGLWFSHPYQSLAGPQEGIPALVEARKRAYEAGYGPEIEKAEREGARGGPE